jgi:hypothetical protein
VFGNFLQRKRSFDDLMKERDAKKEEKAKKESKENNRPSSSISMQGAVSKFKRFATLKKEKKPKESENVEDLQKRLETSGSSPQKPQRRTLALTKEEIPTVDIPVDSKEPTTTPKQDPPALVVPSTEPQPSAHPAVRRAPSRIIVRTKSRIIETGTAADQRAFKAKLSNMMAPNLTHIQVGEIKPAPTAASTKPTLPPTHPTHPVQRMSMPPSTAALSPEEPTEAKKPGWRKYVIY